VVTAKTLREVARDEFRNLLAFFRTLAYSEQDRSYQKMLSRRVTCSDFWFKMFTLSTVLTDYRGLREEAVTSVKG
jgi:hypothetical protein